MAINYRDGKWIKDEELMISVFDLSVIRGYGIFDFLRTYNQIPFRITDHIDRFYNSAKLIGMTPIKSKSEINEIVLEGIKKNDELASEFNIKFIQTGGVSTDGFTPNGNPGFIILFSPAAVYPDELYQNGIKLKTVKLMRQLPYAKTLSYVAGISEVQKAAKDGAVDILYTDSEGQIYEATRSNFFAVKDNKLITADKDILEGITRKVVLEIAHEADLEIDFRCLKTIELATISEAFITNSSQEIMPVTQIDKHIIAQGKCGAATKKLMNEFAKIKYK